MRGAFIEVAVAVVIAIDGDGTGAGVTAASRDATSHWSFQVAIGLLLLIIASIATGIAIIVMAGFLLFGWHGVILH